MITEKEKVTVPKLVKRTGLSRGFFYKNETVRKDVDRALEQQAELFDPKRYMGDIVMKNWIVLLEQQIWKIKRKKENIRLQKALNKKRFESIKKSVTKIRKQFTKARGEIASSFCGWK